MTDLGTLGGTDSGAGINDSGQVVGWASIPGNTQAHAFSRTGTGPMSISAHWADPTAEVRVSGTNKYTEANAADPRLATMSRARSLYRAAPRPAAGVALPVPACWRHPPSRRRWSALEKDAALDRRRRHEPLLQRPHLRAPSLYSKLPCSSSRMATSAVTPGSSVPIFSGAFIALAGFAVAPAIT